LVDRSKILVVALSSRAIAAAATRAGHRVVAVDLFGDADLKSIAEKSLTVEGTPTAGFDSQALLAAAETLAPAAPPLSYGLVYGAGLEAQTELLERLCQGRRLYGNRPETVARLKDPMAFFGALDRLGVPHPAVRLAPPGDSEDWLVKSIGGSGGTHVRSYDGAHAGQGVYYQRRAPGRPIGVSFLADGRRSVVIGSNEQWHDGSDRIRPFRFAGALQPAFVGERLRRDIQSVLDAVVTEFGLIGLNNLDVMDNGESHAVLEINPRPGANLDIFDGADGAGLFSCHLAACDGRLPDALPPSPSSAAMTVVYADTRSRVLMDTDWPEWVADRPAAGARIDQGAPACTVLASGDNPAETRRLVAARASLVRSKFLATESLAGFKNGSQPVTAGAAHA
jgi:uncharacterized protein